MFPFFRFWPSARNSVLVRASMSGAKRGLARPGRPSCFGSPTPAFRRSYVTIELSRRQLMASAGGMALASFALPAGLRKLMDGAAPASGKARLTSAPISEIQHVVVLMQENRSFDHYFGAMPGVRGFSDPSVPSSLFYQSDPSNPDNYLLPFHADTRTTSAQQLPSNTHSWKPQHDCYDGGLMDAFVKTHLEYDGAAGQ